MSIQKSAILTFLLLVTFNFISAQNLYVSKNGVDDTSDPTRGFSPTKTFKTIDFAAKEKAQAGDTIFVKRGNYYNENFGDNKTDIYSNQKTVNINEVHGKRDKYIVIMPYNKERVVFRGDGSVIFQIRNSSYIKVQDFIVIGEFKNIPLADAKKYQFKYLDKNGVERSRIGNQNLTDAQIANLKLTKITESITRPTYFDTKGLLVQSSRHITIENNNVSFMPGTGLRFQSCDNFICKGNTVNNCSRRSAVGTHGLVVHSLKSKGTSNAIRVVIEQNKVHNNYNELYSWSPHKEFIKTEIDEGKGISMQKNYAANGWKNGKVLIQNNITYRNGLSGIHINQGDRMEIVNNVAFRNHFYGHNNNIGISVSNGKDIKVYNNIAVADDSWGGNALAIDNSTNVKASSNLYVGKVADDFAALDNKLIQVTDKPLFTNANNRNFNLVNGSPAINAGVAGITPDDDFFGNDRDNTPDIGAIDYKGANSNARVANDFTPLFEQVEVKRQAAIGTKQSPEIKRISYVRLKQNARSKQFQVAPNQQFNLFEDVQINMQLAPSTRKTYKNLEVYTGRTADTRFAHLANYRDAVVVFNPATDRMTAHIANDQGSFDISPVANSDTYKVTEYWDKPLDCQDLTHEESAAIRTNTAAARMATCEDTDADGNYVIDLFVGYSNSAAAEVADLDAHAQTMVTMVNNGLTNSLVDDVYMRLVGTGTNPENPGVITSVLDDVYDWYDTELQETGADFVASIQTLTGADGEVSGWARIGRYSSVNRVGNAAAVFRHEMGHSVGGSHCAGDNGKFIYAHGHNNGKTRTHLCGNDVNFYSNPNVKDADGVAIGDAATADMARVWRERAEEMASRNFHRIAIGANDDCLLLCKPIHLDQNESINKVELNTINNASGHGTSTEVLGYSDFSDVSTDLEIGTAYTLTLTPNHSFNGDNLNVWVDWNQDLAFERSELITTIKGKGPWTTTITPPINTALGAVKMRVRLQFNPSSDYVPHPCHISGYGGGETEDYTLNILPSTNTCSTVVLNTTDFENGYSIWNDGGLHCRKNKKDAPYASSGEFCVRLKNKGEEAVMVSDVLDLSAYENLVVDFGYYVKSFEKVEAFWLQLSNDGGASFTTVEEWNVGDEFNNDESKTAQVNIAGPFTDNTVLRFRCNASGNGDWVYLDDVTISG
ncbi:MAG: GEVED domain-containing protein, partial [Saprospiraceae bacterium]